MGKSERRQAVRDDTRRKLTVGCFGPVNGRCQPFPVRKSARRRGEAVPPIARCGVYFRPYVPAAADAFAANLLPIVRQTLVAGAATHRTSTLTQFDGLMLELKRKTSARREYFAF
jgi:hypothetical protein